MSAGDDVRLSARAKAVGFGATVIGTAVSFGCSAISSVLIARTLGPSGFAEYGLASVALSFGVGIGLFALGIHLTAELRGDAEDRARADEVVRAALLVAIPTALSLSVLGLLVPNNKWVGFLVGAEVLASLPQIYRTNLDVQMRQAVAARATVLSRLVWVASVIVAISLPGPTSLEVVLIGRLFATGADGFLITRAAGSSIVVALRGEWALRQLGRHLRESAPLAGANLLNGAIYRIDQPILSSSSGAVVTGRYVAAVRVADLLGVLAPVVAQVSLPGQLELVRLGDGDRAVAAAREQLGMTLLFCGSLCAVVVATAEPLSRTLFGEAYAGTGPALAWLAVAEWTTLYFSVFSTVLMANHKRGSLVSANVVGIAVNLTLLLLLSPRFGAEGAAVASAVAYAVVALVMFFRQDEKYRVGLRRSSVVGAGVFGIACSGVLISPPLVAGVVSLTAHVVLIGVCFDEFRTAVFRTVRRLARS